ncbi:hypothetical protein F5Y17DRAFT_318464 [Xylariaceae sp. FL0594]|nr:hypothetical protein F5Y17DRAFT_318464 [Xylariaceae sp. FL0594]
MNCVAQTASVEADHLGLTSASSAHTYKTNVNRTKTRKWVEAKMQSYDGDDWGNDYDDFDDGDDQDNDPEPPPKPTGPRRPGQPGHQLPSARTFPQTAPYGQLASRTSREPPPLHVQTQQTAPRTIPLPNGARSAYAESYTTAAISGSPNNRFSSSQGVEAASNPRYPPRKSSMGQQDRPDIAEKVAPMSNSPPALNPGNRPFADQRLASPSVAAPTGAAKPTSFVRPADIYRRMDEEKERARLSMDSSGRQSEDSVLGRTERASSPGQLRSSQEQSRRTSFESHEGSESAHGRKSTLAPVAERKSEYGMEGLFAQTQPSPLSVSLESSGTKPELPPSENTKEELLHVRRFSSSPLLPSLTRVSGFGVDFFSNAGSFVSTASPSPPISSSEPPPFSEVGATNPNEGQQTSTPGNLEPTPKQDGTSPTSKDKLDTSKFDRRPELPGSWVSESTTLPLAATSEQPTPLEKELIQDGTSSATVPSNTMGQIDKIRDDETPLSQSEMTPAPNAEDRPDADPSYNDKGAGDPEEQHKDTGASPAPGAPTTEEHMPTPPSFQLREREDKSQQQHTSASQPHIPLDDLGFTSLAPLNPSRADGTQPEISLPTISRQRNPTVSTVGSVSPERDLESDKLREEIIKSLSPAPSSPTAGGSFSQGDGSREPVPGNLTRESTYLAGVYDDYLSPAEDKSLQEVSQEAKTAAHLIPSQVAEPELANVATYPPSLARDGGKIPQDTAQESGGTSTQGDVRRQRRFSWQQSVDEEILSPVGAKPTMAVYSPEPSPSDQRAFPSPSEMRSDVVSPMSNSLQVEGGSTGAISHQVSQVSSRAPGDASLSAIEPPSPISIMATKSPELAPAGLNMSSLSLADEKEKALIGDPQSRTSSAAGQHPAFAQDLETHSRGVPVIEPAPAPQSSHSEMVPATFREILNLPSCEERIKMFDETREQFYMMDSGLASWLIHLQGEPEHAKAVAGSSAQIFSSSESGAPAGPAVAPFPVASRLGGMGSQSRRTSIGNVHQLITGQSGSNFNAAGNQVGTKSKEFLHAAGAFGNKGVKSGMKLFNKGKSKLRERTGGDRTFSR